VVTLRGMDDDEKRRTYAAARAIKDHFFAVAKPILFDGEPKAEVTEAVNPFWERSTQGLFVEVYYGAASEIWTPWGKWHLRRCGTAGTSREYAAVMDAFLARVKTTVHEARRETRMGSYGPIYAVVSVDGCEPIPPAVAGKVTMDMDVYTQDTATWAELTAAYDAAHGIVAATSEVAHG